MRVDILNMLALGQYTAKQIADDLFINEKTVWRNLEKIEHINFIKLVKNYGYRQNGEENTFYIK